MERIKVDSRVSLAYSAYVTMEEAMDALDWCKSQESPGQFSFGWRFESGVVHPGSEFIKGEFCFNDQHDHTLFVLRWTR